MLTIAGGIVLGFLALGLIGAILGAIVENAEEIAVGCTFLLGAAALLGLWAFLDAQWPEIDWIKTAFALAGGLFAAMLAIVVVIDSPLVKKLRNRKSDPAGSSESQAEGLADSSDLSVEAMESAHHNLKVTTTPLYEESKAEIDETEDQWRQRVARELRLSRLPKMPSNGSSNYRSREEAELFQAYLKWKDERRDNGVG